ncbi:YqcC family protein [Paraglaciecola sp. L3A3]|uniref:YqcC family protein n=1 Tax=Paraglaciecola sp. L3A3 TaxID=2686358 RepID=UPI00131BE7FD|nr:YqcC family protein [Paraglaciecola sp. L3A3]
MPRSHKEVETLLIKLEHSLKNSHLWSETEPAAEAFTSIMPFAYDTMSLENWLQFIFIPKMYDLIEKNAALPNNMSLYPIAEMHFSNLKSRQALLNTIEQIDRIFND